MVYKLQKANKPKFLPLTNQRQKSRRGILKTFDLTGTYNGKTENFD
jgi:hypothetical protein